MQRSRSLAIAAGVTMAVAGAVSALFLTVGAGASILGLDDSQNSDSSSTVPTPETTGTVVDGMADAEVFTLDENGRLVPYDDSDVTRGSTTTVPARADRYDDSYHEDDDHDDDSYHEDDDSYHDHDDDHDDDDHDDDWFGDSYHDDHDDD